MSIDVFRATQIKYIDDTFNYFAYGLFTLCNQILQIRGKS